MKEKAIKGFTLLELLVSITITTIVICSLSLTINNLIGVYYRYYDQYQEKLEISRFIDLFDSINDKANRFGYKVKYLEEESRFKLYINNDLILIKDDEKVIIYDDDNNNYSYYFTFINDLSIDKARKYNLILKIHSKNIETKRIYYISGGVE